MFSVMRCQLPTRIAARVRSVARTVSSRRRISGRAMELVNGHESILAHGNRGALSILDASFKFARSSLFGSRGAMVNRTNGTEEHSDGHSMSSSAVIGVFAGLMSASVHGCVRIRVRVRCL